MSNCGTPRGLEWAATASLTALLSLTFSSATAQDLVGTAPDCQIQLNLANPAPGAIAVPQTVMISGTALDQTASQGTGISQVQAFVGARDQGGILVGNAIFVDTMTPSAWSLQADFPDSATGEVELFVYALSSVNGQEASVGVPIVVGDTPDQTSDVPDIVCPATVPHPSMPITSIQWMWTASSDMGGQSTTVDDPTQYTLTLEPDGTFNAQADCNLTTGAYTLEGGNVSFSLGPTTLAECPPGSLFSQYLANLGNVSGFSVDDNGNLVLSLGQDGSAMLFAPAESIAAHR